MKSHRPEGPNVSRRRTQFLRGLLAFSVSITVNANAWEPPQNANPFSVLNEAKADADAGRRDDALAKFAWVWEHETISRHGFKDFRAVVQTHIVAGGLLDWVNLSKTYPPARTQLERVRKSTAAKAKNITSPLDEQSFQAAVDLVTIDVALSDYDHTKKWFISLDSTNSDAAKQVFELIEPIEAVLINRKEYRIWSMYGNPDRFFQRKLREYRSDANTPLDTPQGKRERELGQKYFCNRVAMLVCLLAKNYRQADADRIAAGAAKECATPAFKRLLRKANRGYMPAIWWPWTKNVPSN